MTIVAFGNPVYDEITTPFVSTHGRVLSGCSTNVCLALASLGRSTALVGRVGADYYERFVGDLKRRRIVAQVEPTEQTGGFCLRYDLRGDRTLDVLGVAAPIEHVPALCADAQAIVVGPVLQETPRLLVERIAQQSSAPLFLDPQGLLRRIGPDGRIEHYAPADFAAVARLCEVVKANEVETQVLTGIDPREHGLAAVRQLRTLGCRIAIVTLAEAGSYIDDGTQQWRIPAYPTHAKDPTGAGDTYLAGFIHSYLEDSADLFRAGCVGAATASLWIEGTGPDTPINASSVAQRTATLLAQRALPL